MYVVILLILSGVQLFEHVGAESNILTVPDDFPTIQEAVNNAIDGDTVFIRAGTYYEHVVINKTLSLIGENRTTTIVDGNRVGVVVNVARNGVVVSGLTVRRSGSIYWENAGIFLGNVENCSISDNILTENSFAGLELSYSRSCNVFGNSFLSNGGVGVTLIGASFNNLSRNNFARNGWSALTLNEGANNNIISKNIMTSNNLAVTGYCINLYRSNNNNIQENRITGDDNGIRAEYWSNFNAIFWNNITSNTYTDVSVERYSDRNIISGNMISGSRIGVAVSNSRYTEICNNIITHNYGGDEWNAGVRLQYAGNTIIHDNEIIDNWRGIVLYASSPFVSIHGNKVSCNEYGIRVAMGGSSYVNVSGNYVANNRGYGIDVTGFGGGGGSDYATIARNLVVNNTFEAVGLGIGSSYNTVIQNTMIGNGHAGVTLERYSNYNTIVQNNIVKNAYGICFDLYTVCSTRNTIISNNIMDNAQQVRIAPGSVNVWNSIYPSGGNYWSDHVTVDDCSGVNQDECGSDGIVDEPYIVDVNNRDNYPLAPIFAALDIDPATLALESRGRWITAVIELPEAYSVDDIEISSIMLNNTIPMESRPVTVCDHDSDGILNLMVKLDRAQVESFILDHMNLSDLTETGFTTVTLTCTGELKDWTPFTGSCIIRIVCGPRQKL